MKNPVGFKQFAQSLIDRYLPVLIPQPACSVSLPAGDEYQRLLAQNIERRAEVYRFVARVLSCRNSEESALLFQECEPEIVLLYIQRIGLFLVMLADWGDNNAVVVLRNRSPRKQMEFFLNQLLDDEILRQLNQS